MFIHITWPFLFISALEYKIRNINIFPNIIVEYCNKREFEIDDRVLIMNTVSSRFWFLPIL